jgi:hypothetical protein
MGIASGMKALTRDIASSHRERKKKVGEIEKDAGETRGEARQTIAGFARSRRETDRRLRQDLARDKDRRKTEAAGISRGGPGPPEEFRGFPERKQRQSQDEAH